jgi:hypothetical protein
MKVKFESQFSHSLEYDVKDDQLIFNIKRLIKKDINVNTNIFLLYKGKVLNDRYFLKDYIDKDGETISIYFDLEYIKERDVNECNLSNSKSIEFDYDEDKVTTLRDVKKMLGEKYLPNIGEDMDKNYKVTWQYKDDCGNMVSIDDVEKNILEIMRPESRLGLLFGHKEKIILYKVYEL